MLHERAVYDLQWLELQLQAIKQLLAQ